MGKTSQFIPCQGVNYYVEREGDQRPWLLLHGFTGSSQNWAPLWPRLLAHSQLIAVDILGHGRSDAPDDEQRYRIDQVAADLIHILDVLGVDQISLYGYSMGGRLALATAVAYPERVQQLLLESASPGLASPVERQTRIQQDRALADRIEREGIPAFVDYWQQIPLWHSQQQLPTAVRQQQRQQRLQNRAHGLANSLRGMGSGAQPSLWPALPGLSMPVSLLVGELDAKFTAVNRQMAQLLPQASLQIVPGAGHTVHLEQPTAVAAHLQTLSANEP